MVFRNLRGAQFKSATPRTSVAQQTALESVPVQTGAWRLSIAGNAIATEAPARRVVKIVENCILTEYCFDIGSDFGVAQLIDMLMNYKLISRGESIGFYRFQRQVFFFRIVIYGAKNHGTARQRQLGLVKHRH
jgi:hypothetical protein